MSQDIGIALRPRGAAVSKRSSGDHRCRRRGPVPVRGRPHLRRLPGLDQPAAGPLRRPRARPRSSPDRGGRTRTPTATPAATVELIVALRKELTEAGLDAGPDTIGWHLTTTTRSTVSRATISRHLAAPGLVTPEPKKRPEVLLHPLRRRAAQRDAGSPTSPTTGSPDDRRRRRDPDLARRPLPLRPLGHRPPPGHRPDRARPPSAHAVPSTGFPPPR